MRTPANPTAAEIAVGAVMADSGLVAVTCPECGRYHVHLPKRKMVDAPCGATYRLLIEGVVSQREAKQIRYALKTNRFERSAPGFTAD